MAQFAYCRNCSKETRHRIASLDAFNCEDSIGERLGIAVFTLGISEVFRSKKIECNDCGRVK